MVMEPTLPLYSILLLFTSVLFLLLLVKSSVRKGKHRNLPPSPWKLPIIGNMHQLAASGSLPHHTLRDLALKHGPLMYLQLGEVATIIVSSPEMAKEVLKTNDITFSDRPYLLAAKVISYNSSNIVFSQYGPYWRQLRRICTTELLSPSRVHSFSSIREEEVSNLITTIYCSKGSPLNLSTMIFSLTYGITSRAAFGNKCDRQDRFISLISEIMELAAGFCLSDMYPSVKLLEVISGLRPRLEKLYQESDKILENIINQHRQKKITTRNDDGETGHKDLVDVLLEVQADANLESPITDSNIKAVILDVFAAGSETSSTIVEWAMSEMLKNPRVMKEAQAEVRKFFDEKGNADEETGIHQLKYLTAVIKETLRLHPSGPLSLPRECRENSVISGYEIPAKAKVIVNVWAIGRDPKYWRDPERFYPERFLDSPVDYKGMHFEFIPFGAGRRICPGMSFALPNIELPLAKLLYHFDWKLPNGKMLEDLDMTEKFGLTVPRKENLVLIPIPFGPSSVN